MQTLETFCGYWTLFPPAQTFLRREFHPSFLLQCFVCCFKEQNSRSRKLPESSETVELILLRSPEKANDSRVWMRSTDKFKLGRPV